MNERGTTYVVRQLLEERLRLRFREGAHIDCCGRNEREQDLLSGKVDR